METENDPNLLQGANEKTSLTGTLKAGEEKCKTCQPLNPLACVTDCKIWKLKNEFRTACEKIKNPNFTTKLLNTLKNKRRLQILKIISKGRYSIHRLQQELEKQGYYHSQQTIAEEYVTPLMETGLAGEDSDRYYATVFGCRLAEVINVSSDIVDILPPHSECYEEIALGVLLEEPKTYEDLNSLLPAKSVARTLNRLQTAGLIEATKDKDYIFHFRTKRDSNRARFSPTEKRVCENIPAEGISARKLAEKTRISLRRTYKYLRRLKGKKMVFTRKRPKSYALTARGLQTAEILKDIHNFTAEALAIATQIANPGSISDNVSEEKEALVLATQFIEQK